MGTSAVTDAREAAARGEWQRAYDLLVQADGHGQLAGPEVALLAEVAYAAGHLDVTIEVWERVHREAVRAGDLVTAAGAATRVGLHLLFDTGLVAPVRGWIKRAERLLEGRAETPVHAWLAVVRNYERLLSGDFVAARAWAHEAIDVGGRLDPAAAAIGRVAEARSLILEGDVERGLDLLDDAAMATVSGELDPFAVGVVYCELVCALQAVGQYDLAEEWTQAMERWRHGHAVGSVHGRCRVHRAEILRLRGSTADAESEVLRACEELRPYLRRELGWPLTELGRIRMRRGDVDGAEQAFLAAHELGWDPEPGLARVHLARGEVEAATASIRDALERPLSVPSKELPPNTELRKVPLLEAQVEIAIAAGDLVCAESAVNELERIAETFRSKAFSAAAVAARASVRLAGGEANSARRGYESALRLWTQLGAPYEAAQARIGLARAHRLGGNAAAATRELRLAHQTLQGIGAATPNDESERNSSEIRASPGSRSDTPRAVNVFCCEGDFWSITFEGHTTRLRNVKGMRYLARLLADPGKELHVLEMVAGERGSTDDPGGVAELSDNLRLGDFGAALDARAKDSYRRRLAEIDEDVEEARRLGDVEREAQGETERDFLVRELSRAFGLGGRSRTEGSASERARASVTRAVRSAMRRIREHSPRLGEHLDRAIRTGTYCVYLPDSPVAWKLAPE